MAGVGKKQGQDKKYYPVDVRLALCEGGDFLACRRVSLLFDGGLACAEPAYLCFLFGCFWSVNVILFRSEQGR
jgi:hypothetical protein